MDAFRIIISTRLKKNAVAQHLTDLGTDIKYITLRRGEFLLGDKFGIRYLTDAQFAEAIKNRTIYRDILDLKQEYTDPVVIVEGEHPFYEPHLGSATMYGAALFASVVNRVPILTTRNDLETAQLIFMMAAQTGSDYDWEQVAAARAADKIVPEDNGHGDPRVGIIARLPDVGPVLAESLLKHFGSLSKLFIAGIDDLKKVQGVGPRRAEKIFAFLNRNKAA